MQRGDQYSIRIAISKDGQPLAVGGITGLRIKLGDLEDRYPEGTLSYDDVAGVWLFPVTQEQTHAFPETLLAQVQVNFGGNPETIVGSRVQRININNSIIRSTWDED